MVSLHPLHKLGGPGQEGVGRWRPTEPEPVGSVRVQVEFVMHVVLLECGGERLAVRDRNDRIVLRMPDEARRSVVGYALFARGLVDKLF